METRSMKKTQTKKLEVKRKAGRPYGSTKYNDEFCDVVIQEMSNGASIEEVAATLGITKDTFYQWVKRYKDFSDAKKIGEEKSKAWWMKQGRGGLWADSQQETKKINAVLWYMNMKNRFGWSDKHQVDVNLKNRPINTVVIDFSNGSEDNGTDSES